MSRFALSAHSWTEALNELEGILTGLVIGPGGFVVLNVERPDDPFVQVLALGGAVTCEASATVRSTSDPHRRQLVDPVTAERLLSLGWKAPVADPMTLAGPDDPSPNFHFVVTGITNWLPPLLAELLVRTLVEVWGVELGQVRVRSVAPESGKVLGRA